MENRDIDNIVQDWYENLPLSENDIKTINSQTLSVLARIMDDCFEMDGFKGDYYSTKEFVKTKLEQLNTLKVP